MGRSEAEPKASEAKPTIPYNKKVGFVPLPTLRLLARGKNKKPHLFHAAAAAAAAATAAASPNIHHDDDSPSSF